MPEAGLPSTPDNDNIHCLVIGGYYHNKSTISYYRLDFATETESGEAYLPILRNHRYVFNIIKVSGPGFTSATSALNSTPIAGNVDYDLIVWDATIHEMETQGKYYFGIDNRDLLAEAKSTGSDPDNKFPVKYQTNYPLSDTDPLLLTWASTSLPVFNAQWQENGKNILITVNSDNLTSSLRTDTLYVRAGSFVKKIVARQKYFDTKYSIDCSSISVKGIYKREITLNPSSHYITLSITADNRGMQGRSYVIETTDPLNHGISFRAEGIFDFTNIPEGSSLRIDNIRMEGSGTLQTPVGVRIFSLPIVSDSPLGSSCDATIQFVIPKMNILVLSNNTLIDGYAISRVNGGAGKLINSLNNFGPNSNSIVKVEGFNYKTSTTYDFRYDPNSEAYKWVTGIGNDGNIADIVYIAFPAVFEVPTAQLLVEYLDKGGVIVAFLENASTQYLTRYLFNNHSIGYNDNDLAAGSIYPFPAHSSSGLTQSELQNVLQQLEGDHILNGPFGDVRDKQWGQDANTSAYLRNIPITDPNLSVYSYYRDISPTTPDVNMSGVIAFKYESTNRNMVWFGDGGFMSSNNGMPYVSNLYNPLYWDTNTFSPIPKPVYGWSNNMPVYNSIVFCNIMAWAIEKSESLRAKREQGIQ